MVFRIVDAPRPLLWSLARHVQPYYRAQWEMRELEDWQRIGVRRSHLCQEHDFIYLHAPKAASSSVKRIVATWLHPDLAQMPARGIPGTVSGPMHWKAILPRLSDGSTYRFSSCVHPVSRALAIFDHLFVRADHSFSRRHWFDSRRIGLRFGKADSENFDRFLDYVEDVHAESAVYCDPHMRHQSRNLLLGHLGLNRIVRVEAFRVEMNEIAEELGFSRLADSVFDAEERVGKRQEKYSEASDAQLRRIHRLYEEDFDRFGYALRPGELR